LFGWCLVAGADLSYEKNIAGWWLISSRKILLADG
jgi:hypothetical protein